MSVPTPRRSEPSTGGAVLGIETSGTTFGVAVVTPVGLLASCAISGRQRHAELLHPTIETLLGEVGLSVRELSGIAVDTGPGLFTGLRVGVASAKGLALGAGLPLVGVRSTEALIAAAGPYPGPVLAMVDVRRGEVAFEAAGGGCRIGTIETALGELAADRVSGAVPLLVGDAAFAHRDEIAALLGEGSFVLGAPETAVPDAAVIARLGIARLESDPGDPASVGVTYLREADAAITWSTRADEARAEAGV